MNVFNCPEFPSLHGVAKPRFWDGFGAWKKSKWIRDNGHAVDVFEAVAVLQATGDWPSETELNMANGRVLSPRRPAQTPKARTRPKRKPGRTPETKTPTAGREDRLANYY